ncbi:Cyanovirin-N [Mycena rebaudengoi]|nr:Cyanovirin-N [Mycena rebaudengoi]
MKLTFFSSIVVGLLAVGVRAAPINERAANGGFTASCSNISVNTSNWVLTATCRTANGGSETSSIGLNSCVANANGILVARNGGGFSASCRFIGVSNAELSAVCGTGNGGGELGSTLDLNSVLTNRNGLLSCP